MKIIVVGSAIYLGDVEEVKGGILVKDSMAVTGEPNRKHLIDYLSKENIKQLNKPIEFKGAGINYSVRELSEDLALELSIIKLQFTKASGLALPELVNRKFAELVG